MYVTVTFITNMMKLLSFGFKIKLLVIFAVEYSLLNSPKATKFLCVDAHPREDMAQEQLFTFVNTFIRLPL